MPVTWHVDETGLLHVVGTGTVTDDEYLDAHRGFFAATESQVGPRRSLADWSGVDGMQITSRAIQTSAGQTSDEMRDLGEGHRIALVAASPVVYGMCRMWQTLISDSGVECDLFHSREEALAWLDR